MKSIWLLCLFTLLSLTVTTAEAKIQDQAKDDSKQWAIVIAVRDHGDASLDLKFTTRDAESMRGTLMERAGIPHDQILMLSDLTTRPTRATIQSQVPAFLKKVKAQDRLLVFYSGHGILREGKMCLVPADFNRKDAGNTALSISWLQDALAQCPAKSKFLILDACHAGGTGDASTVTSQAMAKAVDVEAISGCVVLASCRSDELSWEWKERRQGVFTYWLCRALEGGGDANGDGRLTADEVYKYSHERVTTTVDRVFNKSQTPVRRINEDISGDPTLLTLRPEPPESLLRRMAIHLDLEIRLRKLKKIGVLEFSAPVGRVSGGLIQANLPRYCADEIGAMLDELSGDAYEVLSSSTVKTASKGIRVEEIGDPIAMRRLGNQAGGMDAVVIGSLRKRGRKINVESELISIADGESLVTPSGVLPLSEDLIADNGASFDNRQNNQGQVFDRDRQYNQDRVDRVLEQAQAGHPLKLRDFPVKIEIRSIKATPNDLITSATPRTVKPWISDSSDSGLLNRDNILISARDQELFEIRVENTSDKKIGMVLLIDGINSLGQKRERMREGRLWVLDAKKSYDIPGWYIDNNSNSSTNETDFTMKRFIFTDIAKSVAGRQQFTDSIGLISFGFFKNGEGRDLAVGEAQQEPQSLKITNFKRSHLIGSIQVRYVDEAELNK